MQNIKKNSIINSYLYQLILFSKNQILNLKSKKKKLNLKEVIIIGKGENLKNTIDNKTTIYYYIVNEDRVVKVTYDRDLLCYRKDWLKNNVDAKNELNELIKIKKGEDEVMEEAIEMIEADAIKRGLQKGLQKGRKEERKSILRMIINNMLQKGISVDEIKEMTGISKKEIEQILQKT